MIFEDLLERIRMSRDLFMDLHHNIDVIKLPWKEFICQTQLSSFPRMGTVISPEQQTPDLIELIKCDETTRGLLGTIQVESINNATPVPPERFQPRFCSLSSGTKGPRSVVQKTRNHKQYPFAPNVTISNSNFDQLPPSKMPNAYQEYNLDTFDKQSEMRRQSMISSKPIHQNIPVQKHHLQVCGPEGVHRPFGGPRMYNQQHNQPPNYNMSSSTNDRQIPAPDYHQVQDLRNTPKQKPVHFDTQKHNRSLEIPNQGGMFYVEDHNAKSAHTSVPHQQTSSTSGAMNLSIQKSFDDSTGSLGSPDKESIAEAYKRRFNSQIGVQGVIQQSHTIDLTMKNESTSSIRGDILKKHGQSTMTNYKEDGINEAVDLTGRQHGIHAEHGKHNTVYETVQNVVQPPHQMHRDFHKMEQMTIQDKYQSIHDYGTPHGRRDQNGVHDNSNRIQRTTINGSHNSTQDSPSFPQYRQSSQVSVPTYSFQSAVGDSYRDKHRVREHANDNTRHLHERRQVDSSKEFPVKGIRPSSQNIMQDRQRHVTEFPTNLVQHSSQTPGLPIYGAHVSSYGVLNLNNIPKEKLTFNEPLPMEGKLNSTNVKSISYSTLGCANNVLQRNVTSVITNSQTIKQSLHRPKSSEQCGLPGQQIQDPSSTSNVIGHQFQHNLAIVRKKRNISDTNRNQNAGQNAIGFVKDQGQFQPNNQLTNVYGCDTERRRSFSDHKEKQGSIDVTSFNKSSLRDGFQRTLPLTGSHLQGDKQNEKMPFINMSTVGKRVDSHMLSTGETAKDGYMSSAIQGTDLTVKGKCLTQERMSDPQIVNKGEEKTAQNTNSGNGITIMEILENSVVSSLERYDSMKGKSSTMILAKDVTTEEKFNSTNAKEGTFWKGTDGCNKVSPDCHMNQSDSTNSRHSNPIRLTPTSQAGISGYDLSLSKYKDTTIPKLLPGLVCDSLGKKNTVIAKENATIGINTSKGIPQDANNEVCKGNESISLNLEIGLCLFPFQFVKRKETSETVINQASQGTVSATSIKHQGNQTQEDVLNYSIHKESTGVCSHHNNAFSSSVKVEMSSHDKGSKEGECDIGILPNVSTLHSNEECDDVQGKANVVQTMYQLKVPSFKINSEVDKTMNELLDNIQGLVDSNNRDSSLCSSPEQGFVKEVKQPLTDNALSKEVVPSEDFMDVSNRVKATQQNLNQQSSIEYSETELCVLSDSNHITTPQVSNLTSCDYSEGENKLRVTCDLVSESSFNACGLPDNGAYYNDDQQIETQSWQKCSVDSSLETDIDTGNKCPEQPIISNSDQSKESEETSCGVLNEGCKVSSDKVDLYEDNRKGIKASENAGMTIETNAMDINSTGYSLSETLDSQEKVSLETACSMEKDSDSLIMHNNVAQTPELLAENADDKCTQQVLPPCDMHPLVNSELELSAAKEVLSSMVSTVCDSAVPYKKQGQNDVDDELANNILWQSPPIENTITEMNERCETNVVGDCRKNEVTQCGLSSDDDPPYDILQKTIEESGITKADIDSDDFSFELTADTNSRNAYSQDMLAELKETSDSNDKNQYQCDDSNEADTKSYNEKVENGITNDANLQKGSNSTDIFCTSSRPYSVEIFSKSPCADEPIIEPSQPILVISHTNDLMDSGYASLDSPGEELPKLEMQRPSVSASGSHNNDGDM